MTEYQAGRASGVFVIGSKIENVAESYKREISNFDSMKMAFALTSKALEDQLVQIDRQLHAAQIPIKESEIAKRSVQSCIAIVAKLYNDAESKRLAAVGAATALDDLVASVKRIYDAEQDKLKQHMGFENQPEESKDPIDRPVGAEPESNIRKTKRRKSNPS